MTHYKRWLRIYLFGTLIFLAGLYLLSCWHNRNFPPTITNSISFDAKLKYLRDHRQRLMDARTIAIGSSICLNNIDMDYLEKHLKEQGPFLNAAAWGLQVGQASQLFGFIHGVDQNLKRVLYVTQLTDFRFSYSETIFNFKDVDAYIRHKDNLLFPVKYFNAKTTLHNLRKFRKNNTPREYGSLAFNDTGSVLLNIHGKDRNQGRWTNYGLNPQITSTTYKQLDSFCREVKGKGIEFITVVTPARGHFKEQEGSRQVLAQFKQEVSKVVSDCGGSFIDATGLNLPEDDFADTLHLNASGALKVTEYVSTALKVER